MGIQIFDGEDGLGIGLFCDYCEQPINKAQVCEIHWETRINEDKITEVKTGEIFYLHIPCSVHFVLLKMIDLVKANPEIANMDYKLPWNRGELKSYLIQLLVNLGIEWREVKEIYDDYKMQV